MWVCFCSSPTLASVERRFRRDECAGGNTTAGDRKEFELLREERMGTLLAMFVCVITNFSVFDFHTTNILSFIFLILQVKIFIVFLPFYWPIVFSSDCFICSYFQNEVENDFYSLFISELRRFTK